MPRRPPKWQVLVQLLICIGCLCPAESSLHRPTARTRRQWQQWHGRVAQQQQRQSLTLPRHLRTLQQHEREHAARRLKQQQEEQEQQQLPPPDPAPIRIHLEYQGLQAVPPATRAKVVTATQLAVAVLAKYIKVRRPVAGPLLVSPACNDDDCTSLYPDFLPGLDGKVNKTNLLCGRATINSSHVAGYSWCDASGHNCTETFEGGKGEETDFYMYITLVNKDEDCADRTTNAWGMACLSDTVTNRPVLGSANLCEIMLNDTQDSIVTTLVHEILHALAFDIQMFDYFITSEGDPLPRDKVVKETKGPYGKASFVISPTVIKEARAQFDCPTLQGAALEDEGGEGSQGSHWEFLWFQGDVMTGEGPDALYGKRAAMSRVTLALLQDTGWYDVAWDQAGALDWGYKAGCDFVTKTCKEYAALHPQQHFFCNGKGGPNAPDAVCAFDGMAEATCDKSSFSNGCRFQIAFNGSQTCLSSKFTPEHSDLIGAVYGSTSRCAPITVDGTTSAYCFEARCTADGLLQYDLFGQQLGCPTGDVLPVDQDLVPSFNRVVIGLCPDNAVVCNTLSCGSSCTAGGLCRSGTCYCNLLYSGKNCQERVQPGPGLGPGSQPKGRGNATAGKPLPTHAVGHGGTSSPPKPGEPPAGGSTEGPGPAPPGAAAGPGPSGPGSGAARASSSCSMGMLMLVVAGLVMLGSL